MIEQGTKIEASILSEIVEHISNLLHLRLKLSSIEDQLLHVCPRTSIHPHTHQPLYPNPNSSWLRKHFKGSSSFHSNFSHSAMTRMPDRRQSNRGPPTKTYGHSHLSLMSNPLTAAPIFCFDYRVILTPHTILTSFNPHHKRTFLTDLIACHHQAWLGHLEQWYLEQ